MYILRFSTLYFGKTPDPKFKVNLEKIRTDARHEPKLLFVVAVVVVVVVVVVCSFSLLGKLKRVYTQTRHQNPKYWRKIQP